MISWLIPQRSTTFIRKFKSPFISLLIPKKNLLKFWLEELKGQGYDTSINDNLVTTFAFGFVSPWQKRLILDSKNVCLDATHSTISIDKGILYPIVIRPPLTGTGCPVAFFFTKDHSMLPIRNFLFFLRYTVGFVGFEKIIIDESTAELNAINAVFPGVGVQWCLFQVAGAWMSKIRELVKLGSSALNVQTHKLITTLLKRMM